MSGAYVSGAYVSGTYVSGAYVSTDPRAVAPLFIDNFGVAIIRLTSIRQIAPVELLRC